MELRVPPEMPARRRLSDVVNKSAGPWHLMPKAGSLRAACGAVLTDCGWMRHQDSTVHELAWNAKVCARCWPYAMIKQKLSEPVGCLPVVEEK